MWVCVHEESAHRGQKRVSDPLTLELESVRSLMMWVLEIEHRFSRRAACTLNHRVTSLTLYFFYCCFLFSNFRVTGYLLIQLENYICLYLL